MLVLRYLNISFKKMIDIHNHTQHFYFDIAWCSVCSVVQHQSVAIIFYGIITKVNQVFRNKALVL